MSRAGGRRHVVRGLAGAVAAVAVLVVTGWLVLSAGGAVYRQGEAGFWPVTRALVEVRVLRRDLVPLAGTDKHVGRGEAGRERYLTLQQAGGLTFTEQLGAGLVFTDATGASCVAEVRQFTGAAQVYTAPGCG